MFDLKDSEEQFCFDLSRRALDICTIGGNVLLVLNIFAPEGYELGFFQFIRYMNCIDAFHK